MTGHMRTRFATVYGPGDVRIEEKELTPTGPCQVLLKVEMCGVCGTDLLINSGKLPVKIPYPNLGHEYCAQVCESGSEVGWLSPGDRVVINPNYWCGHCKMCQSGLIHLCTEKAGRWSKSNGGFADYALVAGDLVHKIPADLPAERAIFAEPLSCCLHGLSRTSMKPGDRIAILGGGTIGLLTLLALRHGGDNCITVSEPVAGKRAIAAALGAERVLDPLTTDVAGELRDRMDVVIDCTGCSEALAVAAVIAAPRGTILAISLYEDGLSSDLQPGFISRKELVIVGAIFAPFRLPDAIRLLSRSSFTAEKLIGSTVELADLPGVMQSALVREAAKIAVTP